MTLLERMPQGRVTTVISVDASDLQTIAANAKWTASESPTVLRGRLTRSINKLRDDMERAAPDGKPTLDWKGNVVERNIDPVKLKDSFRTARTGLDERALITLAPRKFSWTNYGTRPPTFGSGYIFPRKKKALSWFNADHPVWYRENVPGMTATHWADIVIEKYNPGGIYIPETPIAIAAEHANWWVETFTNLNRRRKDSVVRKLFNETLAAEQERQFYG